MNCFSIGRFHRVHRPSVVGDVGRPRLPWRQPNPGAAGVQQGLVQLHDSAVAGWSVPGKQTSMKSRKLISFSFLPVKMCKTVDRDTLNVHETGRKSINKRFWPLVTFMPACIISIFSHFFTVLICVHFRCSHRALCRWVTHVITLTFKKRQNVGRIHFICMRVFSFLLCSRWHEKCKITQGFFEGTRNEWK